jgi:hypothetical protein
MAVLAIIYVGIPLWIRYVLFQADPLPAFMAELKSCCTTYDEVRARFSELVVKTLPIGSNASDAIALTTGVGFEVVQSAANSIELRLERRAGICTDQYFIVIDRNADGTIASASARLHPICLYQE